ncbi:MAG: hypothetical protein JWM80_4390 [Cyanobacteria bacterium RYN_339]|nr:hypothetical protein [Cyanobacteria bacterium RYN_339]
MEWVVAFDLPLPPARAFEAARHFHHAYPRMHPAHRAPTGPVALLAPGYAFTLLEDFGREQRQYDLVVAACDPATQRLLVSGRSITRNGRLVVQGNLEIEFTFAPAPLGCRMEIAQRVRFAHRLLDLALNHRWMWPGITRHVREENLNTVALFLEFDQSALLAQVGVVAERADAGLGAAADL